MKTNFYLAAIVFFATILYSCGEEDEGKLPNIEFKTGVGYTARDTGIFQGDSILVGIIASKAEDKDPLTLFSVSASFDGASDTTLASLPLSGTQGDNFSQDMRITTRNTTGAERYTFTVINRDGLINSVSILITVSP